MFCQGAASCFSLSFSLRKARRPDRTACSGCDGFLGLTLPLRADHLDAMTELVYEKVL
jgi:hypothetical protein